MRGYLYLNACHVMHVCDCMHVYVCMDGATICTYVLCVVSLQSIWRGGTCGCSLPRKEVKYLQHNSAVMGGGEG